MMVTMKQCPKWVFSTPEIFADGKGVERTACIVSAPFCCIHHVEAARHHAVHKDP